MELKYTSCRTPWVKPSQPSFQDVVLILDKLACPPEQESHPDPETRIDDLVIKLRTLVVGEFFRTEFDPDFDGYKPRRSRGSGYQGTKVLVAAEAELWSRTWRTLDRLQKFGRLPRFPGAPPIARFPGSPPITMYGQLNFTPHWIYKLVLESEFLMPYPVWGKKGQSEGAQQLIAIRQKQNALLQALEENPFVETYTKLFIDSAMSAANQCDPFRKNFYTPMVKQRMSVIAGLKKRNARSIDHDGRCARQGRKKKKEKKIDK